MSIIRQSVLKCLRKCVVYKVDSKNEFNNEDRHNTQYHLVVGKTDKEVKSFLLYSLVYYLDSALRIKHKNVLLESIMNLQNKLYLLCN